MKPGSIKWLYFLQLYFLLLLIDYATESSRSLCSRVCLDSRVFPLYMFYTFCYFHFPEFKFNSVIIILIPLSSCPPSESQLVFLPYYLFIYYVNLVLVCRSALLAKPACKWVQSTGWFWKMWNLHKCVFSMHGKRQDTIFLWTRIICNYWINVFDTTSSIYYTRMCKRKQYHIFHYYFCCEF